MLKYSRHVLSKKLTCTVEFILKCQEIFHPEIAGQLAKQAHVEGPHIYGEREIPHLS
jgi:hypothetical protein